MATGNDLIALRIGSSTVTGRPKPFATPPGVSPRVPTRSTASRLNDPETPKR